MRKTNTLFALTLFISTFFFSCSKEDSMTQKLSRSWRIERFTQNGVDKTSEWNTAWVNYQISFTKDNAFTETATIAGFPVGRSGTWAFVNEFNNLQRIYNDNGESQLFKLESLSNSKLVVSQSGTNQDEWTLKSL